MPENNDPYLAPLPDPNRDALADPRVKDFLDKIGKSEGADYNTLVGGSKIKDLSRHPNRVGLTTSAGPSTAFGKYQITGTTDRSKLAKYKNLDYSPENQDLRAVELLRQTRALDALQSGDEATAIRRAGREWASIPGSTLPGNKNTRAWSVAKAVQDPYLAPLPKPSTENDPYLAPLTAQPQVLSRVPDQIPTPAEQPKLLTPKTTVALGEGAIDETVKPEPIKFTPADSSESNLNRLARHSQDLAEMVRTQGLQLPANHPDLLGKHVEARFTQQPTAEQVDDGLLEQLGKGYGDVARRFREEMGVPLSSGAAVEQQPDGSFVAHARPTQGFIDAVNAYAMGGRRAYEATLNSQTAGKAAVARDMRAELKRGEGVAQDIGQAGAREVLRTTQFGQNLADLARLKAPEDDPNAQAIARAAQTIPEPTTWTGSVAETGIGTLGAINRAEALGGGAGFPASQAIEAAQRGPEAAYKAGILAAPIVAMGPIGQAVGAGELSALERQALLRTVGGGGLAASTAAGGGSPRDIATSALTGAAFPVGAREPGEAAPKIETERAKPIIRHSDPRIDGGEVVGRMRDGKLKVQNNEGGISVVQNPRTQGNREAAIVTPKEPNTPVPLSADNLPSVLPQREAATTQSSATTASTPSQPDTAVPAKGGIAANETPEQTRTRRTARWSERFTDEYDNEPAYQWTDGETGDTYTAKVRHRHDGSREIEVLNHSVDNRFGGVISKVSKDYTGSDVAAIKDHFVAADLPDTAKPINAPSVPQSPAQPVMASTASPAIVREGGVGTDALNNLVRPNHAYRGMTSAEFEATVKGQGHIQSRNDSSFSSEGTSFSERPEDAESYVNSGRDDPRKTGKPTYLVEVARSSALEPNRQGYLYAREPIASKDITRIWEMRDVGGKVQASEIPVPQSPTSANPEPKVDEATGGQRGQLPSGEREPLTRQGNSSVEAQVVKPWEMTPAQIEEEYQRKKAEDDNLEASILGPELAKKYDRLQRKANSTYDTEGASAAYDEIQKIENSLSETDRNRLYGIGEEGPQVDELRDYRDKLNRLDKSSPQALGESLQWAVTELAHAPNDPAEMNASQRVRYAQMREAARYAREEGWDTQEISRIAVQAAGERFADPEDAQFMLERFLKKEPQSTVPERKQIAAKPREATVAPTSTPSGGETTGILSSPKSPDSSARSVQGKEPQPASMFNREPPEGFTEADRVRPEWEMSAKEVRDARLSRLRQQLADVESTPVERIKGNLTRRKDRSDLRVASQAAPLIEEATQLRNRIARIESAPMDAVIEAHKGVVERALREGKPVPPEVLADYPDLATKVQSPESREAPTPTAVSPEILASQSAEAQNTPREAINPAIKAAQEANAQRASEVRPARAPKSPVVTGKTTTVRVPGSQRTYEANYAVRELGDVVPSNNPQNFQPNPDYYHVNDRRYEDEPQYQTQIINRSRSTGPEPFAAGHLVNNSITADSGPPIIDSDGNVLGGNSRSMILSRVYSGDAKAAESYKQALKEQASVYGIDPKSIDAMKQPVLVREIDSARNLAKPEIQRAITELNVPSTTPLTREEQGASSRISEAAADFISRRIESSGEDATLSKVMDDHGTEIINRLIEDGAITAGERNTLIKDGSVTAEGKARVERALTGRLYSDLDQLKATPASVRANIERAAPALLRTEGTDWDIIPTFRRAIDAATESRSAKMPLEELQRQVSMVHEPFTDEEIAIAKALSLGPRKAVEAFRKYAGEYQNAKEGGGLFGSMTQAEAFDTAFNKSEPEAVSKTRKQRNTQAGAVDVDLLTLGVRPFAKDVAAKGREVVSGTREISNGIKSLLAPPSRSEAAQQTSRIVRANAAEMQRAHDIADKSLEGARKFFSKQQAESNYDFIDKMERGQPQADPNTQKFADTFRQMLDQRRDQIRALGTGKLDNFIEDYFPHVWKDPAKAKDAFTSAASKRPFEGSKSFLKKRTLPLTSDGLALGLEPVSDNPVDLAVLKLREMDKYLMAHQVMGEMKDQGNLKFFKVSERLPDGWAQIDDRVATVFSRSEKGELILRGRYAAPEPAAKIINNYLSPGLNATAFRVPFKAWRATSNLLNQFQLGFSAFHAGFTTVDAMVSRAAAGLEDIARGRPLRGAATVASVTISPITNLIRGSKMLKEWYQPGTQGAEIGRLVQAMQEGGGRARMDQFYSNNTAQRFMDTLRQGNVLGAAIRAPGAIIEGFSKPVMEQLVPRQKMGIFADLAKRELERLGPDATQAQQRHAMAKAWDSVDNRMGQLVYDNLFWNKTLKDLSMASVRSVGWNIGTIREVGGGLYDTANLLNRAMARAAGKRGDPLFTHRMAYTAALPLVVGTMGAVTQYLLTGKGPDELKDYFFPKTGALDENGNPERISFPSYMKDVFHAIEEPGKVITNKLHPLAGMISEMLRNEDYYGTKIRNEDDPLIQQLKDVALHVGQSALPFSVRGYQKETERGGSLTKRALPFVGITPAPSYINKSPAEKLISEKVQATLPRGARTREEADRSQLVHQLQTKARNDQDITSEVQANIKQGKLRPDDARDILRDAKQTPLQLRFKHLPLKDALEVWDVMSTDERSDVKGILADKASSVDDLPETEQPEVRKKMEAIGLRPGLKPRKPREAVRPQRPRRPSATGYVFQ